MKLKLKCVTCMIYYVIICQATAQSPNQASCSSQLGMEDGSIPDEAITASTSWDNSVYAPHRARLNEQIDPVSQNAGWCQAVVDAEPWIQADVGVVKQVVGVIIQGRLSSFFESWVTSFEVLYSVDEITWKHILNPKNCEVMVYPGTTDMETTHTKMFPVPVNARFIRIKAVTWHVLACLRFELLGCTDLYEMGTRTSLVCDCQDPMGMESNDIPDKYIQASSSRKFKTGPHRARLNTPNDDEGKGGWRPDVNDPQPWIQVNMGGVKIITGVVTQGMDGGDVDRWVTEFEILTSTDGMNWETITDTQGNAQVFHANFDTHTRVINMFPYASLTRYVRIIVTNSNVTIGMRFEIIGCYYSKWTKINNTIFGNVQNEHLTWEDARAGCDALGGARLLDGNEHVQQLSDSFGNHGWTNFWGSYFSEYELVYKAALGSPSEDIRDLYMSAESFGDGGFEAMSLNPTYTHDFVNPLLEKWNNINVQKVKVAMYSYSGEVVQLILNGTGSDYTSFFQKQNLINSSWSDLSVSTTTNYFSVEGHSQSLYLARTWYINRNYGGCNIDEGWFVVIPVPIGPCSWEQCSVYPCFLYSSLETSAVWGNREEQFDIVGKPSSQSDTTHEGAAEHANDGNTAQTFSSGSCTHTSGGNNKWWKVDMEQTKCVTMVRIYNRVECCSQRLVGSSISIGMNEDHYQNDRCADTVTDVDVQNGGEVDLDCAGLCGRYLAVLNDETQTLCEVQVFTSDIKQAEVFGVSIQYSDFNSFCRKLNITTNGTLFSDDIPCNQEKLPAVCKLTQDCNIKNGYCSHSCVIESGEIVCTCPEAMQLEPDQLTCTCKVENGYCSHDCAVESGEIVCTCPEELALDTDQITCTCKVENGYCSHDCAVESGEIVCTCPEEMELDSDQITCIVSRLSAGPVIDKNKI